MTRRMLQSWYSSRSREERVKEAKMRRAEADGILSRTGKLGESVSQFGYALPYFHFYLETLKRNSFATESAKANLTGGNNMKTLFATVTLLTLAGLTFLSCNTAPAGGNAPAAAPSHELAPLQLIQRIPVPGVAGRIDHFTAFPKRRLLIFAGLGNNTVEIVNTFEGKVVHSIQGLDEPQGVVYVPEFDKVFVANAGNGTVNVYDGKTYALRKSIALGEESDTDNLRWDEASKRVFVGNVPDDGSVVNVIDRKTGGLTKWELNGAKANYPMALDEDDHRLFVVTRRPPLLVVLDTDTGKEVARVPVGGSCDDLYFDAERKRIYALGGEGFISVIQQNDPNHYTLSANIPSTLACAPAFSLGRACTSACPRPDWNPRKYGIMLCRSRVWKRNWQRA